MKPSFLIFQFFIFISDSLLAILKTPEYSILIEPILSIRHSDPLFKIF